MLTFPLHLTFIIISLTPLASAMTLESNTQTQYPEFKFRLQFNPNLPRLGNAAEEAPMPSENAGQNPLFGKMAVHWIELAGEWTRIGEGAEIYKSPQKNIGVPGNDVIDYNGLIKAKENEIFLNVSMKNLKPGNYTYIRTSVAYQRYDIKYNFLNINTRFNNSLLNLTQKTASIASFLGVNTFIDTFDLDGSTFSVGTAKLQGFGAMKSTVDFSSESTTIPGLKEYCSGVWDPFLPVKADCSFSFNSTWDGTPNATTVPNANPNVEIPPGSCIVVGKLLKPITIPDTNDINFDSSKYKDILITLRYSINGSFEWIENIEKNGEWDIDLLSGKIEPVVDMGTRGLWPIWEYKDKEVDPGMGGNAYMVRVWIAMVFVVLVVVGAY